MKMSRRSFIAGTSAALTAKGGTSPDARPKTAPTAEISESRRFEALLERNDPIWEVAAEKWSQGVPLGNGDLGVMIWGSGNPLCFTLDKTDLWEKRHWTPDPERFKWREFRKLIEAGNVAEGEKAFERPADSIYPTRLPVGRGELHPVGKVKSAQMRLDLHAAAAHGELVTDAGTLNWQAFVHATKPLIIVELAATGKETNAQFSAVSFNDAQRGVQEVKETLAAWGYSPAETGKLDTADYWAQTTPAGGQYAVAWRELAGAEGKRVLVISIAFTPASRQAAAQASATVAAVTREALAGLLDSHRRWWAAYYPAAFVSIPDPALESLYWIEMYKLGSATRPDKPALALHGPWSEDGRMPPWSGDYHWNINMQMTYWPIYTGNRLPYGEAVYAMIDAARPRLREWCRQFLERDGEFMFHATDIDANPTYDWASGQFEFNGLSWVAHHYWLHWRYSQDRQFLAQRCLPLMKEAVRPYLDELQAGPDGRLHLPWGFSPEYSGRGKTFWGPDCTCDLAFIRFLCESLLEGHAALGSNDAEAGRWQETLQKLAPYPQDEDGLKVRADLPYHTSHRHASHLIPIYPLKIVWQDSEPELVDRSMRNWIYEGHGEWVGFSLPWGACLAANTGRAELARTLLHDYAQRFATENTFHMQGPQHGCDMSLHGTYALTLEAGFGAAAAIQEMLLQSQRGVLHVFPAAPPAWMEAVFENLRGEGAFRVSAVRRKGKTVWAKVISEAGGTCRLQADFGATELRARTNEGPKPYRREGEALVFDTVAGEAFWVAATGANPPALAPVKIRPENHHYYGVKELPRW